MWGPHLITAVVFASSVHQGSLHCAGTPLSQVSNVATNGWKSIHGAGFISLCSYLAVLSDVVIVMCLLWRGALHPQIGANGVEIL